MQLPYTTSPMTSYLGSEPHKLNMKEKANWMPYVKWLIHLERSIGPCCSARHSRSCATRAITSRSYSLSAAVLKALFHGLRRRACSAESLIEIRDTIGGLRFLPAQPTRPRIAENGQIGNTRFQDPAHCENIHCDFGSPVAPMSGEMAFGSIIETSLGPSRSLMSTNQAKREIRPHTDANNVSISFMETLNIEMLFPLACRVIEPITCEFTQSRARITSEGMERREAVYADEYEKDRVIEGNPNDQGQKKWEVW